MHDAAGAVRRGRGHDVGRAPHVDLLEVVHAGGVDDAGCVDHVDGAGLAQAVEEGGEAVGASDVTHDRLDSARLPEEGEVLGIAHERAHGPRPAEGAVRPAQVIDQGAPQPTGRAGHDRDVRRCDPLLRPGGHGLTVSMKRRALRMATAITDA